MTEKAATTGSKRKGKTVFEKATARIKDTEERNRTRVVIGPAFQRWRQLKVEKRLQSDAKVALFLLDSYDEYSKRSSSSTSIKTGRNIQPLPPPSLSSHVTETQRAEVKVAEKLDNTDSWETSAEPMGASIEMEWNPDEDTDSVSEDGQMGLEECDDELEEDDAESEEDDARLNGDDAESAEDSSVSVEDEMTEEDVSCHDDSDDEDYYPPIDVRAGDGLNTSVHKFRDRPKADKKRTRHCEDAEEKLEATSSDGGDDDSDVCGQINMAETKDNSTAASDEPVDKQTPHEKPSKKPPENPDQEESPHQQKIYECPSCGKVVSSNNALARHLVIHSGERPYKCFICARGFTQSGNLKTHMKIHKGEVPEWKLLQEAPKTSYIKAHVCGHCGMDFPDRQQLEEHRESHKWPYNCSDCGKSYKNEEYFKAHQRMHAGEVNLICSKCGKRWPTMASLQKHELTHNKKRNFHCKQCGKAFSRRFGLKLHLRVHRGEAEYLCTICGKGFVRAEGLRVHVRVHTGERPYTCDKCGKDFYYRQGFQQHLLIHDKKLKPPTKPLGRPKQLLSEVNS